MKFTAIDIDAGESAVGGPTALVLSRAETVVTEMKSEAADMRRHLKERTPEGEETLVDRT